MSAYVAAAALLWSMHPADGARPARTLRVSLPALSFRSVNPLPTPAPQPTHHFLDTTNIVLTAIESGGLLADGITTQRALRKYPGIAYEADPIARPFVSRGWPGALALDALVISADWGFRYLLHRANHHRLERWLPVTIGALTAGSAIHNAWLLGRIRDEVESRKDRR